MNVASELYDLASKYHVEMFRFVGNFVVSVTSYTSGQRYVGEGSTIEAALEDLLNVIATED